MPNPLLCTQTSAKFAREARLAISPSSRTTTFFPSRPRPQAIAEPSRPPPTMATSYSFGIGFPWVLLTPWVALAGEHAVEPVEAVEQDQGGHGDRDHAGRDGSHQRIDVVLDIEEHANGQRLGAGRGQEDGHGQIVERLNEGQRPAADDARQDQRQGYAAEHRPTAGAERDRGHLDRA